MKLTRDELAAALRAARRYPPGSAHLWGTRGTLAQIGSFPEVPPESEWKYG